MVRSERGNEKRIGKGRADANGAVANAKNRMCLS